MESATGFERKSLSQRVSRTTVRICVYNTWHARARSLREFFRNFLELHGIVDYFDCEIQPFLRYFLLKITFSTGNDRSIRLDKAQVSGNNSMLLFFRQCLNLLVNFFRL